jgi:hypothetical protein
MRLGIDLDGCLYPWVESLRKEAEVRGFLRSNMPEPTRWEFWEDWGMTYQEFKAVFTSGVNAGHIFAHGKPEQGGLLALGALKADGHTLHIISNRSVGHLSLVNTAEWIDAYQVPYDTFTLAADKTIIKTDIAIDDYTVNLNALRDAGTRAVCFDRPWNQDWDGERVPTWIQFYRLVSEAS